MKIVGLDHIQIAIPVGAEELARAFYIDLLGLQELPKPTNLALRGGLWLECGKQQLHLGVEQDFRPAKKAHPALLVEGLAAMAELLISHGSEVKPDQDLPGIQRLFVTDPFGNRIELLEYDDSQSP